LKYSILWADQRAKKTLENLPTPIQLRIKKAILILADNPRPTGVKKMSGRLDGIWRIRVGDWRILYDIDDKTYKIILVDIGPRKSIYR
jgi:mRNA interferase RelE/StbE